MEHLLLKAVTTATDQGTFEAVISAATIDRERDHVDPAGMVRALQKWTATGKNIPLAWNHSTKAEEQIGYIDPASAREVNGEVVVKGWIDQSIPVGKDAWRLVKTGTLGFSFGYLVPEGGSQKNAAGGRDIHEMDVFEVTATPTPMNNDTRVLGWKAPMTPPAILEQMLAMAQQYIDNAPDAEDADEMRSIVDDLKELVSDVDDPADQAEDAKKLIPEGQAATEQKPPVSPKAVDVTGKEPSGARSVDPLRAQARRTILEIQSDGLSQQPPRKAVIEPEPEPVDLAAVRVESRRLMVQILSGGVKDS